MGDDCWRIDDLAHEAGITVDTIRYYAREGLMPVPTPAGRHKLYGDRHLDRLRRIKELQERRFSLAAIRAIVETNRPGIDDLFAGSGRTFTLAELIERSGVADRSRRGAPGRRPAPRPHRVRSGHLRRDRPPAARGDRRAAHRRHARRRSSSSWARSTSATSKCSSSEVLDMFGGQDPPRMERASCGPRSRT